MRADSIGAAFQPGASQTTDDDVALGERGVTLWHDDVGVAGLTFHFH